MFQNKHSCNVHKTHLFCLQVKKIFENEKRLQAGDHSLDLLALDFEKNYNMYIFPVHWQFGQLDQHPSDGYVLTGFSICSRINQVLAYITGTALSEVYVTGYVTMHIFGFLSLKKDKEKSLASLQICE